MLTEKTKKIYEQIFDNIYPQVKKFERGVLYKTIQVILGNEHQNLKAYAPLDIKTDSSVKEDYEIISTFVELDFIERMQSKIPYKEKEMEIKWIIIGACIFVGLSFCIIFLNKREKKRERIYERTEDEVTSKSLPIPAELCLIVPAKAASTLMVGSDLKTNDVLELIDNATYFLCSSSKEADSKEKNLDLTEEYVSPDSQREVYVRVNVSDGGRVLIGKGIPYALKSNLPPSSKFIIKQLACLKNLSGLEVFNRI